MQKSLTMKQWTMFADADAGVRFQNLQQLSFHYRLIGQFIS